jgi:nicotinamidase-related amidase
MGTPSQPFLLGAATRHLCIDMQRLFSEGTPWHVPWLIEILPTIEELAGRYPRQTIFTRFIPPRTPDEAIGAWRDYYSAWPNVTRERLDEALLDLVPPLSRLVPPAKIVDKGVNSAFSRPGFAAALKRKGIDTLVITGGETDVCVLATVMAAIDHGFRIVLPTDALCSTQDSTHDALLQLYRKRFSHQVEATLTANVIDRWKC